MQTTININRIIIYFAILFIAYSEYSCKKLVEVNPPSTRISAGNVYNSDITAIAVLTGIYSKISGTNFNSPATIPTISLWTGLSSDELSLWSGADPTAMAYYKNSLSVNVGGGEFWGNAYSYVYTCNAAIEGLSTAKYLTPSVKNQLLGEAKFCRALFYFYLVNLYGDVPLALTTDYTTNSLLARHPMAQVYQNIIDDLKDAQNLLKDGYVQSDATTLFDAVSAERVRPNKAAATALLARTYLYVGDYVNAEKQSSAVINNTEYYSIIPLNEVYLKNSKEAIWQLQPVDPFIVNTEEAFNFVLTVPPAGVNNSHPVYLSNSLINSVEPGDKRFVNGNWVNEYTDASGTYFYPYKYKDVTTGTGITPTEYSTILRLGEQYLIRAEARALQNKITEAQDDLNVIRNRSGLANTTANNKESLLSAIFHERRVELFTELGHRWLDLKRTGNSDKVMSLATVIKGGKWNSHQMLYPLPLSDILKNPSLIQNPMY